MRQRFWIGCVSMAGLFVQSASLCAQEIPGVGPVGKPVKLHTGFKFTEGPASDGKGNLYFSDVRNKSIHIIDAAGKLSTFTEDSGQSNGLMFNKQGELVACEMTGQVVAWNVTTKQRRVLIGQHNGQRFNAPNDLVIDKAGGFYFTDPSFAAPMPYPQGKLGVYYVTAAGEVTRLIDDLPNPNGVILSPDEQTLYVIPSGQAEMMKYPVTAPGKIGKGSVYFRLKQPEGKDNTGGDGLAVDTAGNLYITSALGVQVVTPGGLLLGVLAFEEQPANCSFAGPGNHTLYVTARTSVYTLETKATGHVFAK